MDSLTSKSFAAVIFDVDGTLVDSLVAIGHAWATWLREQHITPDPSVNLNGMTTDDIVRLCLPDASDADVRAAVDRILELEATLTDGITALPGAREALETVPVAALATSATAPIAAARLAAAGLSAPAVVVTADDIGRGKPDPEIFLAAAERLGVRLDDCLVVEDAPAGVRAGKAGGAAVLALLTTSGADELTDADLVVPDLSHVVFQPDADRVWVTLR